MTPLPSRNSLRSATPGGQDGARPQVVQRPSVELNGQSAPASPGPRPIGWREYIDLPEWNVEKILAKSDTGALGCAIDVANIEELPGNRVRFDVVTSRRKQGGHQRVETEVVRRARVRSSNGALQTRLSVATTLRVGNVSKRVEFSLVSRESMLCRVLLGRKALERDFLVDAGRKFLLSSPPGLGLPGSKARPLRRKAAARSQATGNPPIDSGTPLRRAAKPRRTPRSE